MAGAEQTPRAAMVELVQGDQSIVIGVVDARERGHLHLVDDLLKLQLTANRLGFRVRISEVREELRELFELMGLEGRLD